jgi:hypothetical protein
MALPKKVVTLGVERTDQGLLGQGMFYLSKEKTPKKAGRSRKVAGEGFFSFFSE